MDSSTKKKLLDAEAIARYDPFSSHNNIRVTATYEVHGGCLAALADSVGGWTASSAQHRTCVTVNYAFHFLRPAMGTNQKIRCRATPEKTGRTLSVYHVSLTDDEGLEVATGNFTFFMMDKRLNGTTPERLERTADES